MKKILFISNRNPFAERFSGDVIRAKKFVKYLSRNNYVKVISPNNDNTTIKESKFNYEGFESSNFFSKFVRILLSLFNFKPMQLGFFYNSKIDKFVKDNFENYDYIFFQSFRSAQYLPEKFIGITILDLADLMSKNYKQTSNNLIFLNPLKFIYFLESKLLKSYEKFCLNNFEKILLHSEKEIKTVDQNLKKKIYQYSFGVDRIKNKYKYNVKNNKIIFIGNIKYMPNKKACYDFANKILPKLIQKHSDLEFHIIGEISKIDAYILKKFKGVKVIGKVNNLEPYLNKVICGIANLKISSGIQTKILTYMSYGIPSICSQQVYENFDALKKSKINYYKNDNDFIKLIIKLKKNKNFGQSSSKLALKNIRNFKWEKILPFLNKVF